MGSLKWRLEDMKDQWLTSVDIEDMAGCFWGQRQPPKPLLLPPLSVDSKVKEATGTQRARWPNVFVIRSSTGAALVSDVLDTLRQRYPGLSAQTSDEKMVPAALEQAEAVVVLLTTGVLAEGSSSMLQLRYAVQNAKPLFAMYSATDWQFGGDESNRAPRWVTGVVSALEAMTYRTKWENEYEFLSMCDELLLRMVSPLKQLTPLSDAEVAAREEQERRSRASEAVQAKPASSTQPNAPTRELQQLKTQLEAGKKAEIEARRALEAKVEAEKTLLTALDARDAEIARYKEELQLACSARGCTRKTALSLNCSPSSSATSSSSSPAQASFFPRCQDHHRHCFSLPLVCAVATRDDVERHQLQNMRYAFKGPLTV
eukprot:g5655.t1